MAGTIYALLDPAGEPRYVGQTIKRLEQRKSAHKHRALNPRESDERSHALCWMRSVEFFTIIPLETDVPNEMLDEREAAWITIGLAEGWELTNFERTPKAHRGYKRNHFSGRRIFTDEQVMEIRRRWAAYEPLSSLAAAFGCTPQCISYIGLGTSYPQLPVIPREMLHGRIPAPCSVEQCGRLVGHTGGQGMCKRHYTRWRRETGRDRQRPPKGKTYRLF